MAQSALIDAILRSDQYRYGIPTAGQAQHRAATPTEALRARYPLVSQWLGGVAERARAPLQALPGAFSEATGIPQYNPQRVAAAVQGRDLPSGPMPGLGFGLGAMTAWHGSPHLFGKFDFSKIGTGEGNQTFGHGLYFAENPAVGKGYQERLSAGRAETETGTYRLSDLAESLNDKEKEALNVVWQNKGDFNAAKNRYPELADSVDFLEKNIKFSPGALYKVDIPDEQIPNMLDWHAPLSEQQHVMTALGLGGPQSVLPNQVRPDMSGEELYNALARGRTNLGVDPSKPAASAYLRSKGIPGVKYWDAGSRESGQGTRNYVTFGDEGIKILERR